MIILFRGNDMEKFKLDYNVIFFVINQELSTFSQVKYQLSSVAAKCHLYLYFRIPGNNLSLNIFGKRN